MSPLFFQFNLTGLIWKEEFDCEPKPDQRNVVITICVTTGMAIILLYTLEPCILPFLFPKKIPRAILVGKEHFFAILNQKAELI